ncbi:translation initiation factor IF-2-like [Zalophus californianus]|uniref:Translation initiation factor IF-2-like n=1 Tax=Zalophus californianus TaxID=9704 RepID=A0A6P9EX76_ZALCA|nr:translation initiation factor IF-2-like [Zalophus californianus]
MKQRGRCSISFMKGLLSEKRSAAGKTKTRRQKSTPPRSSDFRTSPGPTGAPHSSPPYPSLSRGLAQESPAGPSPKTTESCRTAAPQARPAPRRPPTLTGSSEAAANCGGRGGAASRGPGVRPPPRPLCLSGSGCPRRAPRRKRPGRTRGRPGAHTLGIVLRTVRVQASRRRGVPDLGPRRQDDASVFVLPELASGLPSPGGRRPRPARAPPEARGGPVTHPPSPRPGTSRRAPSPSSAPLTLRGQECKSRARARRRRGGAGPGPPGETSRAPRSGRRGPGAGRRRRRREDRRPRRLTLPAALARRHLTPPPAAGWADSEGDRDARREAWAPEGPPVVLSVASATAAEVAWLLGASEPQVQVHTGPRSVRLTLSIRPAPGQ